MGGSGAVVTYRELDDRSNRLAQLFRARGLKPGDHIALFMENHPRFLEVAWAAQRSGLYYTAINNHLTAPEAAYIVNDCNAQVLVTTAQLGAAAHELTAGEIPAVHTRLMIDGAADGWDSYEDAIDGQPATPVEPELEGQMMLYSSGTTGRPKGVRRLLERQGIGEVRDPTARFLHALGMDEGDAYVSPAPMYHAAPLAWSMGVHRVGGTVVVMERFDPEDALALIERYHVTHSQWVPTMFVRMLKLPEAVRDRYDLSSHRVALHAAAPCPVAIKQQMIEWWGPIIHEYYSGTEGNGSTYITSEDWLRHPGSVGRSLTGHIHILDDDGNELPSGEPGTVWFSDGSDFEYHNDPEKTAGAYNEKGWSTLGDVGYVDDEGYLYLTDRKAYMVISGGVNIYPQEAENVLVTHPKVLDVAVFGVPNDDLGEEVKAVVQPIDWSDAGPDLERELVAFCREQLAAYKCPRSIDFERELPRLATGKLYKRLLRDRYWGGHDSRIV
jgi:acyl-CoA synthetase (AMP-forming)/AMP-acid ligase II